MRHFRFLPLSLCLLLAACGGDELLLHFDTPVHADAGGIHPALQRSLEQALADQLFGSEQFDLKLLSDQQSVRVRFSGEPLDAARRQSLQDYFAARLDARKQWSGKMSLLIQPERLDEHLNNSGGAFLNDEQREQLRKKAEGMRPQFGTTLAFSGEVELVYEKREQPFVLATSTDKAFCQISAALEKPLPQLSYRLQTAADPRLDSLFQLMGQVVPISIPHHLRFADTELQTSIDNGSLAYVLRADPLRAENGGERSRYMVFEFGSVGEVTHMSGQVSSMEHYERDCLERVIQAGRPFTYFYGKSLDRLQSVEYRFKES